MLHQFNTRCLLHVPQIVALTTIAVNFNRFLSNCMFELWIVLFFVCFWIFGWFIFSSTLQCLLKRLALLIGLDDSLPMHSFSRYGLYGHITCLVSVSAATTHIIFRNRGRLMASLFRNVLCSSILAGDSHSECFFESVTVFDIVIHRQIYWFI